MPGSTDRLRLWAQVITGMQMDAQGNIMVMTAQEWQARHRLDHLGEQ
jgi:hypothetical protein